MGVFRTSATTELVTVHRRRANAVLSVPVNAKDIQIASLIGLANANAFKSAIESASVRLNVNGIETVFPIVTGMSTEIATDSGKRKEIAPSPLKNTIREGKSTQVDAVAVFHAHLRHSGRKPSHVPVVLSMNDLIYFLKWNGIELGINCCLMNVERIQHRSHSPAPEAKRELKREKRKDVDKEAEEIDEKSVKKRKSSPSPSKKKRKKSTSGSEDSDVAESESNESSVESTPEKKKKKKKKSKKDKKKKEKKKKERKKKSKKSKSKKH